MENGKNTFGIKLRTIRRLKGISQEALAEAANKSVEAVSNTERGVSLPSYEMMQALADGLGIQMRDFFDVDDGNPKRLELMTQIMETVRGLDDAHLRIAAKQLAALGDKSD